MSTVSTPLVFNFQAQYALRRWKSRLEMDLMTTYSSQEETPAIGVPVLHGLHSHRMHRTSERLQKKQVDRPAQWVKPSRPGSMLLATACPAPAAHCPLEGQLRRRRPQYAWKEHISFRPPHVLKHNSSRDCPSLRRHINPRCPKSHSPRRSCTTEFEGWLGGRVAAKKRHSSGSVQHTTMRCA